LAQSGQCEKARGKCAKEPIRPSRATGFNVLPSRSRGLSIAFVARSLAFGAISNPSTIVIIMTILPHPSSKPHGHRCWRPSPSFFLELLVHRLVCLKLAGLLRCSKRVELPLLLPGAALHQAVDRLPGLGHLALLHFLPSGSANARGRNERQARYESKEAPCVSVWWWMQGEGEGGSETKTKKKRRAKKKY
jgi:hypothetical protein